MIDGVHNATAFEAACQVGGLDAGLELNLFPQVMTQGKDACAPGQLDRGQGLGFLEFSARAGDGDRRTQALCLRELVIGFLLERSLVDDTIPQVHIVIRSHEAEVPPPIVLQLRVGGFEGVPGGERGVNAGVGCGRMGPVVFQRENAVFHRRSGIRSEEKARVVEQNGLGGRSGIPGPLAPHAFIDVVMNAVGISHKAHGHGGVGIVLDDACDGAGIDRFSTQHVGESAVDVFIGKLAAHVVRQIGIEPDGVHEWRSAALFGDAELCPRAVDYAGEVAGLMGLEEMEEGVVAFGFKPLVGDPEFGVREIRAQQQGQVFKIVQDLQRVILARVASGHENRVQSRQFLVQGFLGSQFRSRAAGKHGLYRGPETVIQVVVRAEAAQIDVHLLHRGREVRAGARVQRIHIFYGICAKDDQFADVLLVGGLVPGVAGVIRVAVAELVPADGVGRSGRDIDGLRESGAARAPFQRAQQRSCAEQGAARIVPQHPDDRTRTSIFGEQRVAFGNGGSVSFGSYGDHRAGGGHGGCRGPVQPGTLEDLFGQDLRSLRLGRWGDAWVHDYRGIGQIDRADGRCGEIGHVDPSGPGLGMLKAADGDLEGYGVAARFSVRV